MGAAGDACLLTLAVAALPLNLMATLEPPWALLMLLVVVDLAPELSLPELLGNDKFDVVVVDRLLEVSVALPLSGLGCGSAIVASEVFETDNLHQQKTNVMKDRQVEKELTLFVPRSGLALRVSPRQSRSPSRLNYSPKRRKRPPRCRWPVTPPSCRRWDLYSIDYQTFSPRF